MKALRQQNLGEWMTGETAWQVQKNSTHFTPYKSIGRDKNSFTLADLKKEVKFTSA